MSVDTVVILLLAILIILMIAIVAFIIKLNRISTDTRYHYARENDTSNDVRAELTRAREQQLERHAELQQSIERRLAEMAEHQSDRFSRFSESTQNTLHQHRQGFEERQLETLKIQQENLSQGINNVQQQVTDALTRYGDELGKRMDALSQTTDQRLKDISGQVEKRLSEGFEKTTATFTDVLKRLALIDEAQKKIAELSGNVVSLQEVLADKRSRGAFGEVQLSALVRNVMPENSFEFQYSLPNDTRADCMLFLPQPTGNIAIDSKFPLESFRKMTDIHIVDSERQLAERQFKQDIRKHIKDIAGKYILPGVTSDGAVMFIPAEAVFAEIHAHFYDLVEEAQRAKVWLVSPTTLMAVLTTARAVLKDSATRQQVHIIQDHLMALSKDFDRFKVRMGNLSKHIHQAQKDVEDVNTSARKISNRFEKIEKVEILDEDSAILLEGSDSDDQDNNKTPV
ncbi:MAG: DNA recombination protein RmuC [Gammaproteobacteria bacterium]|nr:DNA recombination protein RmuC [Gammaproteobacteria bacterium]MCW9003752.1 DNA recombination protein RmuC [Gammaproteobacteria bacterium]MCW9055143.1 DNA recombination protein RmuC [Gammaproteobacteria bacterium]